MYFHHALRYKAWKFDSQHTGTHVTMYLFIRPLVLFISKIDMLGHNMRAYGGKYGITLSRHKILNQSKTGPTCKLGPDSAT